jgi:hypothetical protein
MFFPALPLAVLLARAALAADVVQIPTVALSEGAACACTQLAAQYSNLTLYSNSSSYTNETTNYWDIRADLLPECIFLPINKDQVANAIATLASCGAQFAVRGGGHMNVS